MKYREILEQNRTFILERPVHNVTTFIYITPCTNMEVVFDQKFSDTLDKLREITNLIFIFNKSRKGEFNFRNFATLYRASGYIESNHDHIVQSVYYALSYFRVLYERHTGYLLFDSTNLRKIDPEKIRSIVYNGALTASVFKKERMSLDYLKSLIFIKNTEKLSFWDRVKGKVEQKYTCGMYSRYITTLDNYCIYLRPAFVDQMREFLESSECPKYFLESFYNTGCPEDFIPSIAEYLPGDKAKVLDLEIQKIDLR